MFAVAHRSEVLFHLFLSCFLSSATLTSLRATSFLYNRFMTSSYLVMNYINHLNTSSFHTTFSEACTGLFHCLTYVTIRT